MDSLLWLWLALFGAAAFAFTAFFDKIVVSKLIRNPWSWYAYWGAYYLLVAVPLALVACGGVPAFSLAAASAGLIAAVAAALYIRAIVKEDISNVAPLLFTSPLFAAAISAVFLSEPLTLVNYAGVLALVLGAAVMGVRDLHKLTLNSAAKLALANAAMSGACAVLFRVASQSSRPQEVMLWFSLAYSIAVLAFARSHVGEFGSFFLSLGGKGKAVVLAFVPLSLLAQAANITAYSLQAAPLVAAVGAAHPLFVFLYVLLASTLIPHVLKEEVGMKTVAFKAVGGLLIMLGVFLVS